MVDNDGLVFSATVYRDGDYAKVTEKTKNILLVAYAPRTIERTHVVSSINMAVEHIILVADGKLEHKQH